jgi:probable FeS assembly SUF system protein SufT
MNESGYLELTRDIDVTQIPSGNMMTLPAGTSVIITQALGGSYTVVVPHQAGLFRVKPADADALGRTVETGAPAGEGPFEMENVWEQLRNCYDPEIPVNIVDLGLIYSLDVQDAPEGGKNVDLKMTLTAPGCGMGPSLAADAEQRILSVPGVSNVKVELVWDPPWSPDRISEEGRQKLGMV